jgi:uncharacterized protein DUF4043
MASTGMLTSNNLTVKLWEKKAWLQAMQRAVLGHAFNRGSVYFPEKLKGANAVGDSVTFPYVGKLIGIPIGEGGTGDGNEEALELENFSMVMDVCRLLVLNPNKDTIEQERTTVDFEVNTRKALTKRAVELLDASFFYQLAGANPTSLTINGTTYSTASQMLFVQGLNTPIAPTTNRQIWPNGWTNDQSLTANDVMTLDMIDYALEKIDRSDQTIEMLDGDTYDLYVSPEQLVDLQQNTVGKIQWFNIELAKIIGQNKDNMIENRFQNKMICAGKYRNVYIYSAPRVAYGVNSSTSAVITTVRRAVLVGADAIAFASPFGGRVTDTDVPMKFFFQLKDYDYYKGSEARMIYGMRKMSPSNKDDIGVMVLSTYAAPHA